MFRSPLFLFVLLLLSAAFLTLAIGELPFPLVVKSLFERWQGLHSLWNPLLDERLPRLLVLLCTGASLATAGAVVQALFQNPLASPSVLGISAGSTLFIIPIILFGWHLHYPFALPIASIAGAFLSLLLVYTLYLSCQDHQISTLLLIGIAFSTLLMALQGAFNYALRDQWQLLQTLAELEAGSSDDRNWTHVHLQMPLTLVGLYGCLHYAKELDILSLGDDEAHNLGVPIQRVRFRLFFCVALLVGGAIAAIGSIAFFGFLLPTIVRKIVGPNHQRLIPLCICFGALVLTWMDLFLRIFHLYMFSIGNLSAIIGGIVFLGLLFYQQYEQSKAY
jgi:iron complex transport system permease protein